MLSGETSIGVLGNKYRSLVMGDSKIIDIASLRIALTNVVSKIILKHLSSFTKSVLSEKTGFRGHPLHYWLFFMKDFNSALQQFREKSFRFQTFLF
jgi:hypothetical protein